MPADPAKLLFVISTMAAGGAERVASVMLEHWSRSGRETRLLTFTDAAADHYPVPRGVVRRVLNLSWASRNVLHGMVSFVRRILLIRREIVQQQPRVVVSFIDQTNVMVLLALLGTGIPVIVSERIDPGVYRIGTFWTLLRKMVYRCAAQVVVQTDAAAGWARTHTAAGRVKVIPNPLSLLPEVAPWHTRANTVTGMGRLVPQKGFDLLLRAFAASRARAQGWRLTIIGGGPEREALEQLAQDLGVSQLTEFTGIIQQPAAVLNKTRVFVLASRFEGFPNALLEGLAMGCACIAADCRSGPAELISDGDNGLLVPVEDVPALTAAIDRLAAEPEVGAELSAHARATRQQYSAAEVMALWDNLLDRVISNNRGNRI